MAGCTKPRERTAHRRDAVLPLLGWHRVTLLIQRLAPVEAESDRIGLLLCAPRRVPGGQPAGGRNESALGLDGARAQAESPPGDVELLVVVETRIFAQDGVSQGAEQRARIAAGRKVVMRERRDLVDGCASVCV